MGRTERAREHLAVEGAVAGRRRARVLDHPQSLPEYVRGLRSGWRKDAVQARAARRQSAGAARPRIAGGEPGREGLRHAHPCRRAGCRRRGGLARRPLARALRTRLRAWRRWLRPVRTRRDHQRGICGGGTVALAIATVRSRSHRGSSSRSATARPPSGWALRTTGVAGPAHRPLRGGRRGRGGSLPARSSPAAASGRLTAGPLCPMEARGDELRSVAVPGRGARSELAEAATGLSSQACHPVGRPAAAALLLVARGAGGDDDWRGDGRRVGAIK